MNPLENSGLLDLGKACESLKNTDKRIEDVEKVLSELKAHRRLLSETTIPSIMEEMGISEIKLADGSAVSVKSDVTASVSRERMPEVTAWLEEHGFGDLIKTSVVVHFPRLQLAEAEKLANQLIAEGYDTSLEETVHIMTLKAWIKEQLALGNNIPLELFNAFQINKTTIKNRK